MRICANVGLTDVIPEDDEDVWPLSGRRRLLSLCLSRRWRKQGSAGRPNRNNNRHSSKNGASHPSRGARIKHFKQNLLGIHTRLLLHYLTFTHDTSKSDMAGRGVDGLRVAPGRTVSAG